MRGNKNTSKVRFKACWSICTFINLLTQFSSTTPGVHHFHSTRRTEHRGYWVHKGWCKCSSLFILLSITLQLQKTLFAQNSFLSMSVLSMQSLFWKSCRPSTIHVHSVLRKLNLSQGPKMSGRYIHFVVVSGQTAKEGFTMPVECKEAFKHLFLQSDYWQTIGCVHTGQISSGPVWTFKCQERETSIWLLGPLFSSGDHHKAAFIGGLRTMRCTMTMLTITFTFFLLL